jgi:hypothetical protein
MSSAAEISSRKVIRADANRINTATIPQLRLACLERSKVSLGNMYRSRNRTREERGKASADLNVFALSVRPPGSRNPVVMEL